MWVYEPVSSHVYRLGVYHKIEIVMPLCLVKNLIRIDCGWPLPVHSLGKGDVCQAYKQLCKLFPKLYLLFSNYSQ